MRDNKKQVNIKLVEQISDGEMIKLVEGLKKIDGFDFLVDCQFRVYQTRHESHDHI
jgi:hypothetical protein